MALVLRGYSLERRQFDVFWSDKHIGTYHPHDQPKTMTLLRGVLMEGDLARTWISAFPEARVADWRQP